MSSPTGGDEKKAEDVAPAFQFVQSESFEYKRCVFTAHVTRVYNVNEGEQRLGAKAWLEAWLG